MKKLAFLAVFLVLLGFSVCAADITVSSVKEQDTIEIGGKASFIVKIKNEQVRDDTFILKPDSFAVAPFSDVVERVEFDPSNTITIAAHQEESVKVTLVISNAARPDKNYITSITIKSLTNSEVRDEIGLSTYVISGREIISIESDFPEKIIPGKEVEVTFTVKNTGNVVLNDIDLFYTSAVFDDEGKITLLPTQEKEISLPILIDPSVEVGAYTLTVRAYDGDQLKGSSHFDFSTVDNPDLVEKEKTSRGFLSSRIVITKENSGNTNVDKVVKHPIGGFRSLFTKVNPETEKLKDVNGESYYEWEFTLEPGESYIIEIKTDYKLLFFIIVAIVIILGLYFFFRQKSLKLTKQVIRLHDEKEDTHKVKVLLHLKNKTTKEVYNIKLIDLLPAYVHADMEYGTLRPKHVQEGSKGLRLIWEIGKIDPGEERVISYKFKTTVQLSEQPVLPSAMVQYFGKGKRVIQVKSGK